MDNLHKNHLYLSVHLNYEEGVIAEPLNLTVSLRGTREARDNCQLFRLTGLLDAFSEPTFRKVLGSKIDEGPKHIILDLSQIDFVDSSGLGALVQLAKQAQNASGTLQIVTNARVTQTVKLVRLEKFLSLQPSVEAALENVKQS
jgi:anti-anti-sigma factor